MKVLRTLFPGVEQLGHEGDHSCPSSAKVKNVWSYTSIPQYVMSSCPEETGVSKSLALTGTKLLKLKPFKTTVVHELQPHDNH
jgi:hypothetical protein